MENHAFRSRVNLWAVLVAAVAAFITSSAWYIGFGSELAKLSDAYADAQAPSPWVMLAEFLRGLAVAYLLARFVTLFGIRNWKAGLGLGAWLWAFPFLILLGSILHEGYPVKLAAIHAGDWLIKLLLIALIVCVWRRKKTHQ